ncbi:uncharacterized protein LOC105691196 isoform X1 [Athalia rosae]|uniref:uncharacterized protein LOC105691196 isoform X1 n=2 Tax=Athalia rosae TaxID=37344 RepID=UPI002033BE31|nr:uncharacterized protein LOC105691196 isoform X1 [Athalia rosae]
MSYHNVNGYRSSTCNILDIPDEMLIEIISYLNARDRLTLSCLSRRFNALIFEEKKSLRALDFSEKGYLTSMSDILKYFNNKNKYEHIHSININNVYCTRPAQILQCIGKAVNLVDINITGNTFKDVVQLASFLKPLKHVKKLCINWPTALINDVMCCKILEEPFGRLTHLTLTLCNVKYKKTLIYALELCQNLEELCLLQTTEWLSSGIGDPWFPEPKKLTKLRVAACCGCDTEFLRRIVVDMLPNPEQWAKFQPYDATNTHYFYFEREVQVFKELYDNVRMDFNPFTQSLQKVAWFLLFECLLREVIKIIDHSAPSKFCCLSHCTDQYLCLLRIKEAKLLLKNPRHQLTYLYLNHNIEPGCDVHLVAATFPSLSKLVLSNVIKSKGSLLKKVEAEIGFKRKRLALEEQNHSADQSSFSKLVEATPNLKDLTLCGSTLQEDQSWDLSALHLIKKWESLTTLCLANLPIRSGQFLVEIGKQCTNLELLRLENLGARGVCCYRTELQQMLTNCQNLKDFAMRQDNLGQVSPLFAKLSENPKLRRVCVSSLGKGNIIGDLVLAVGNLMSSANLILFVCEIEGMTQAACTRLKSNLQRLKEVLHRPTFQFEVNWLGSPEPARNVSLHSIHKDLLFPLRLVDALYRLDCS